MLKALGSWDFDPADRLGGGGYAQVYRCHKADSPAVLRAIKIFDNNSYVNTLEKEVKALEVIQDCPHTPKLLDYGRGSDGRLCIVTELVSGTRLDRHVRANGVLSLDQTFQMLRQMLTLLTVSHDRGLLHKDIKASNLMIDGDSFCLLDWGVAEFVGDQRSEGIRANQDFVAPECFGGHHTYATDFYSLAWLAVFALTGKLPYHFDSNKARDYRALAHVLERPELSLDIAPPMRWLLLSWLGKDPAQRYIGYDIDALLATVPPPKFDVWGTRDYRQLQREFSYAHLAARHGVAYAQLRYAEQLLEQSDRTSEAIYWLEQAHFKGYIAATYRLARVLEGQRGADLARVQSLLLQAAQAGNSKAQYMLAMSALQSRQGARDVAQAEYWLRLSAAAGHAQSQFELGQLLKNELHQDTEADLYFGLALDRGWPKRILST